MTQTVTDQLASELNSPEPKTMELRDELMGMSCVEKEKVSSAGTIYNMKYCHEECSNDPTCNFSLFTRQNCVNELTDGEDIDSCDISCYHSETCNNRVKSQFSTYSKAELPNDIITGVANMIPSIPAAITAACSR